MSARFTEGTIGRIRSLLTPVGRFFRGYRYALCITLIFGQAMFFVGGQGCGCDCAGDDATNRSKFAATISSSSSRNGLQASTTFRVQNWLYTQAAYWPGQGATTANLLSAAQNGFVAVKLPNDATISNLSVRLSYSTLPAGADPSATKAEVLQWINSINWADRSRITYRLERDDTLAAPVEAAYPAGADHVWVAWKRNPNTSFGMPSVPFMRPELEITYDVTFNNQGSGLELTYVVSVANSMYGPFTERVFTDADTRPSAEFRDAHDVAPSRNVVALSANQPIQFYHWLANYSSSDRTFAVTVTSELWGLSGFTIYDGTYDSQTETVTRGTQIGANGATVAVGRSSSRLLIFETNETAGNRATGDTVRITAVDSSDPAVRAEAITGLGGPNFSLGGYTYYLPCFSQETGYWTGVAFSNSNPSAAANVSVTVYDETGAVSETQQQNVAARGQALFVVTTQAIQRGWMQVNSDQPLTGLCFVGNGATYMADIPMAGSKSTVLHVPHVAQNANFDTTFYICNPNSSSTQVTLTYVDRNGTAGQTQTYTIGAMGMSTIDLSTHLNGGTAQGGKVEIGADQGVAAFALYYNTEKGGHCYAGINAVPPVGVAGAYAYYLPYFSQETGYWTGVAFSNSNPSAAANVSVMVYDESGAASETQQQNVAARGQALFVVTTQGIQRGWMQVNSDQPLTGLCFVGNGATYMADIPMAGAKSTVLHVPHVAQNANFDTTFYICNPNGSSTQVTLTYVDRNGTAGQTQTYTIGAMGMSTIDLSTHLNGGTAQGGKVEIGADQGVAAFALYYNTEKGGHCYAGINAVEPD